MLRVVCWKWDTREIHPKKQIRFGAEHVNRLYSMVSRHLHIPFEFVCITDDPTDIRSEVRIVPLWPDLRNMGGCYVRLKAFSQEARGIIGDRFVSLDLDTVIVDDITPIFNIPDQFKIWGDTAPRTPYNGSLWMMDAGARAHVWDHFDPVRSPRMGKTLGYIGTDQAWIGACLGKYENKWTTEDGVYSYRVHFKKQNRTELYPNARIIFFHGSADPSQREVQTRCPWVAKHWC